ncbi:MAG: hypothetical protein CMM76_13580 [Rhodospirillaceae bacterium]|nr:hypothetical protein [Rhodospirillaceae bacterium]|tara:strand:+ start:443 stop:832 length:390 start_codon:yes stop_codon:yes gene_type:complete
MSNVTKVALLASAFVIVGCFSIVLWNPTPTTAVPAAQVQQAEPDLQNDEDLQRSCAHLFREIITVQNTREERRELFEGVQLAFNKGTVEDVEFKSASSVWLQEENELATQAAHMYEQGRSMGCFQKVTQ